MPARGKNVLGQTLQPCSMNPLTGFYRTGCCDTGPGDLGLHLVCAEVTAEFLEFSAAQGNDLSTPAPQFGFPGLRPGDRWCLCATRWKEAWEAGVAPRVVLEATHISTLEFVSLEELSEFAVFDNDLETDGDDETEGDDDDEEEDDDDIDDELDDDIDGELEDGLDDDVLLEDEEPEDDDP